MMAVEDHPKFEEWKAALEILIEAKEAQKAGEASQKDVDEAVAAYVKIADEV
jgi:hypothetical protein